MRLNDVNLVFDIYLNHIIRAPPHAGCERFYKDVMTRQSTSGRNYEVRLGPYLKCGVEKPNFGESYIRPLLRSHKIFRQSSPS